MATRSMSDLAHYALQSLDGPEHALVYAVLAVAQSVDAATRAIVDLNDSIREAAKLDGPRLTFAGLQND